jgi:hypothetical protein
VECGTSAIWDVKHDARKSIKEEVGWSSWDLVSNHVVTTVGDHLSAQLMVCLISHGLTAGRAGRLVGSREADLGRLGGLPCAGDLADCDLLRGEAVGDFLR